MHGGSSLREEELPLAKREGYNHAAERRATLARPTNLKPRIGLLVMKRRPSKPFQFGLASIFLLTTAVAVILRLGPGYWLHMGGVLVDLVTLLIGLSIAAGLLCLPYLAVVGLAKVFEVARDVTFAIQDRHDRSQSDDSEV